MLIDSPGGGGYGDPRERDRERVAEDVERGLRLARRRRRDVYGWEGPGVALHAPQLIVDARMLYLVWLPADPDAAAALVPDELAAREGSPVFMNQYVVDDAAQTSSAASERLRRVLAHVPGRRPRGARHRGRHARPLVDALLRLLAEHDRVRARRTASPRPGATELDLGRQPLVATTRFEGSRSDPDDRERRDRLGRPRAPASCATSPASTASSSAAATRS